MNHPEPIPDWMRSPPPPAVKPKRKTLASRQAEFILKRPELFRTPAVDPQQQMFDSITPEPETTR